MIKPYEYLKTASPKNINVFCRICNKKDVEYFYFDTAIFPLRNKEEWGNYYCKFCHCVSHFNFKNEKTNYSDGTYRERNVGFEKFKNPNISPPIDLPWSTITFLRWEKAVSKMEPHLNVNIIKQLEYLDFGGYNGLTAYGIKEYFKINKITIADVDLKGLRTAENFGFSTINLDKSGLSKNKYDLITSIQVLEHLEKPSETLLDLVNALKFGGIIYVEVPNVFSLPLTDTSHLSMFSIEAITKMFSNSNLKILDKGFLPSRRELINLGVFYFSKKESIYIIAKKEKKIINETINHAIKSLRNIDEFKHELQLEYARSSLYEISFNIFKKFRLLLLYYLYYLIVGVINLIGLKIYSKFNSYRVISFFKKFLKE